MIKMPGAAVVVGAFSSTTSSGKPYAALAICMAYIFIWLAAVHVHMWLESQKINVMMRLDKHVEWHEKVIVRFEHS